MINVSKCRIGDIGLRSIALHCKRLKTAYFCGCLELTVIPPTFLALKRLSYLDFRQSENINQPPQRYLTLPKQLPHKLNEYYQKFVLNCSRMTVIGCLKSGKSSLIHKLLQITNSNNGKKFNDGLVSYYWQPFLQSG